LFALYCRTKDVLSSRHRVLRGNGRIAGSSFSPHVAVTTTPFIDTKGVLEDAQQHFHERLLAEVKKPSTTATTPFTTVESDTVSVIQESVQSFYNALDGEDTRRIKDNFRKLSTEYGKNDQLASIIQEIIQNFKKKDLLDQEYAIAADETLRTIHDAARKLNAALTTTGQQQEELTTNKETMMSAIMHDLTMALEENGDPNSLVTMIKSWQSSMETLHDAMKEHHPIDTTAQQIGNIIQAIADLLISLITLPLRIIEEIINIITREPDKLFKEGSGYTDVLVAMIKDWQSSMETFHDTMKEHHPMDTAAQQIGNIIQAIADLLISIITLPLRIIEEIINIITRKPDELFNDKMPKW
jgi:cell division protein ZapA (FtsZ GTPase activity inhibitor)